jgi:hypothetical protein
MENDLRRWMRLVENASSWSPTEREIGVFLYGGCAALALAIQKRIGLPLVALVEPDGENDNAVHVMAKAPNGRYLDIGGLRTYKEVLADLCDNHQCNTADWSLVSVSPVYLKLCIKDGIFDPISPGLAKEANEVAARLITAYGIMPP